MNHINVYCPHTSNRLIYMLDWLLKERLQLNYTLANDENDIAPGSFCISYNKVIEGSISIPDTGFLWQKGTTYYELQQGDWNGLPVIFTSTGAEHTLPFDLFSAIFFLLSRYEEYYPYTPDKHNRYPAAESILYKHGWLLRPIIDEWVVAFKVLLEQHTGESITMHTFSYTPTYDIDIAYSHLHKGMSRTTGAYIRSAIGGKLHEINERTKTLLKKQADPYDSFQFLDQLHDKYSYHPIFFLLASLKTTTYDKNIHPGNVAMTRLIKELANKYAIGMHPSYYSDNQAIFTDEKKTLETITGKLIHLSRQHYIKVAIPGTYHILLKNGIDTDYSMGYGSHLGFRAGTGSSFLWYDVERDEATKLRIYPFCFMDTTAHYEVQLPVNKAFEHLQSMTDVLRKCNSNLITVFHNFSLGTAKEWKGWREAYEQWLKEMHSPK